MEGSYKGSPPFFLAIDVWEDQMKKVKTSTLVAVFMICALSPAAFAQDGSRVLVLKFSWEKERIRPRPSLAPLASQDELIQQSRREQQLAAARNASNKSAAARLETQISNHQQAAAKASQTELPRDGYKYKLTLRNEGVKTIKSIDWDYLFLDPTTQQEISRHQFTSDETIKPGKNKEISVLYLIPPVKLVRARMLNKKDLPFTERVVVARIQYSDGSFWQRP
jgi:hypothetical protein